ncbi:DUF3168 domain-containing protein [Jeotgalibacillus haloalkalitolerans]|uniref:DUF3168 domain-containing protein n=1 Tax=Jeotgalibacillus haloalkalitolerans TaxID=3104292 RepID=A0ABU5KLP1_9BACL|nr:DUF3168 domain-containing protein [Jeotgalibacillus sp. HH7-29]MDZ5711661.1 DUF3168 domain-containing protein [Jeotgalibacillus sp. HH7-29]
MAIQTAIWELQQALFGRLNTDAPLNSLILGVYDYVPSDTAFPYIQIGEPRQAPFADKSSYGEELSLIIHTWSTAYGNRESYLIINAVIKSLFGQPLELSGGFSIVKMDDPSFDVIDDIDGVKRHGIIRLKFYLK